MDSSQVDELARHPMATGHDRSLPSDAAFLTRPGSLPHPLDWTAHSDVLVQFVPEMRSFPAPYS